jgi:hypothetical protein
MSHQLSDIVKQYESYEDILKKVIEKIKSQIPLRILSCIQIANKICSNKKVIFCKFKNQIYFKRSEKWSSIIKKNIFFFEN